MTDEDTQQDLKGTVEEIKLLKGAISDLQASEQNLHRMLRERAEEARKWKFLYRAAMDHLAAQTDALN